MMLRQKHTDSFKELRDSPPFLQRKTLERSFQIFFYAAIALLWGASVLNGTIKALLLAVWHGRLEDGTPLKLVYTGLPPLDYPLAVLVAFFFSGTSGQEEAFSLFLFDLYILLQLGYLWLYAEAIRPGEKSKWIENPVYFALLWQACGGAVALPLYFGLHIGWSHSSCQKPIKAVSDLAKVQGLAVAFWLGAVVPMLVLMAPTWLGPEARSTATQQTIIALFQPTPVYFSCIMDAVTHVAPSLSINNGDGVGGVGSGKKKKEKNQAKSWLRGTYLVAAILSGLGHLYVMARGITTQESQAVSLIHMYLPFPSSGPSAVSAALVRGTWLFLQWDNVVITLASLLWASVLLSQTRLMRKSNRSKILLLLITASVALGPGTAVTLTLYVRESHLVEGREE